MKENDPGFSFVDEKSVCRSNYRVEKLYLEESLT